MRLNRRELQDDGELLFEISRNRGWEREEKRFTD